MAREATLSTRKAWLGLIPVVKIKLMRAKSALHGTMVVAWHLVPTQRQDLMGTGFVGYSIGRL